MNVRHLIEAAYVRTIAQGLKEFEVLMKASSEQYDLEMDSAMDTWISTEYDESDRGKGFRTYLKSKTKSLIKMDQTQTSFADLLAQNKWAAGYDRAARLKEIESTKYTSVFFTGADGQRSLY